MGPWRGHTPTPMQDHGGPGRLRSLLLVYLLMERVQTLGLHGGVVGGGEGSFKAGLGGEVETEACPPGELSHNRLVLVTRGSAGVVGRIVRRLESAGGRVWLGEPTVRSVLLGPGLMVSFCSLPPHSRTKCRLCSILTMSTLSRLLSRTAMNTSPQETHLHTYQLM